MSNIEEFAGKLRYYIDEEVTSWSNYSGLAVEAEQLGLEDARLLREMAADESKHASYLRGIIKAIELKGDREELKLGGEMVEVPLGRPFPQTYSDWVDLAEAIKARYPDDPVMRAAVNFSLGQVAEEKEEPIEAREEREQAAQEGKRWLSKKAGELGIR